MKRHVLETLGVVCFAVLASAPPASATPFDLSNYKVSVVDYPVNPAVTAYFQSLFVNFGDLESASFPLGINNNRQLAGDYTDINGIGHGYVWQGGNFTSADYPYIPGSFGDGLGGINSSGQVVGDYYDAAGYYHGFLTTCTNFNAPNCGAGSFQTLADPNATPDLTQDFEFGPGLTTAAIGINNSDDITGLFATTDGTNVWSDGFFLSGGNYLTIDNPNAAHLNGMGTKIFSLSNNGVLAGDYEVPCGLAACGGNPLTYGFLYDTNNPGNPYIPIFVPGSDLGGFGTQVVSVNDSGEAVGVYSDSAGNFHGFVYKNGQYLTLDYPGAQIFTELHGINDNGDISGGYFDPSGVGHGFVAFVVPEPGTLGLAVIAGFLVIFAKSKRA